MEKFKKGRIFDMFKEDYRPPKKNNRDDDFLFDLDISNSVSAYDFTGAVPVPPRSEDEKKSYMSILNYSPESINVPRDIEKDNE